MKLINSNDKVGIANIHGNKKIEIRGGKQVVDAIKSFSKYGLITFSREQQFKSSHYTIHFFKPTSSLRNLYNLGDEVLIVCSTQGMNDFKSRTKDFLDYLLITSEEFKNRLDKITCFLFDTSEDIVSIVKSDRIQNPDARLIVPFNYKELSNGIDEDELQNRLRDFLYERDLFGIASPLNSDTLFFGKDRTNIISELYGKYKQGEQGGLFGLRRIGKTSVLNLLKLRIEKEKGAAIYFDCSQYHHNRWNEFLEQIIKQIQEKYSEENELILKKSLSFEESKERYKEKNAMTSFRNDIKELYSLLGNTRILLIFDEIESISYTTSPSKHWKIDLDALYFWQALRAIIQTNNEYFSFVIAGVNPRMAETGSIGSYDNPIFGIFKPIYMDLFDFDDVKKMTSDIGSHIGLKFEEPVYSKLLEDYGGHPFLTRQICSKINSKILSDRLTRPTTIKRYTYEKDAKEYKMDMVGVIEQILGVLQSYYIEEFELLKKLALDGRSSFQREISSGEKEIQHLTGYRLIEREGSEYFIRIKSIEEYIKDKFMYDKSLNSQKDKRSRLNMRRDKLETKLREIVFYNLQAKYGKKAKDKLISYIKGEKTVAQCEKMSKVKLKDAMEELYFLQLKQIMVKDWKDYQNIFHDRVKFEQFFDLANQSRGAGDHSRTLTEEDEAIYKVAFKFFEDHLDEY